MPRATKGKAAKTVVKTGVTTGTAVALLFLSASAAFAAAAFTIKPRVPSKINPSASVNIQKNILNTQPVAQTHPDLAIQSADARYVMVPDNAGVMKPWISLHLVLVNNGNAPSTDYQVWLDQKINKTNSLFGGWTLMSSGDDLSLGSNVVYGFRSLEPGETREYTRLVGAWDRSLTPQFPSLYGLEVNRDRRITETDFTNNATLIPIALLPPQN